MHLGNVRRQPYQPPQQVRPVSAYVVSVRGDRLLSWLIARISRLTIGNALELREIPSHSLIAFEFPDGHREYYEALEGSAHGWAGPKPFSWLTTWRDKHPGSWIKIQNITPVMDGTGAVADLWYRAERRKTVWTYSVHQLLALWRYIRLGGKAPSATPDRVVCCEAVIRLLNGDPGYGEHPLLPRGWNSQEPDAATPVSLMLDIQRLLAARNRS